MRLFPVCIPDLKPSIALCNSQMIPTLIVHSLLFGLCICTISNSDLCTT